MYYCAWCFRKRTLTSSVEYWITSTNGKSCPDSQRESPSHMIPGMLGPWSRGVRDVLNDCARVASLRSGVVCPPWSPRIAFCVCASSAIELRFHEKVTCPCSFVDRLSLLLNPNITCSGRRPHYPLQACTVAAEAPMILPQGPWNGTDYYYYCRQWGINLVWTKKGSEDFAGKVFLGFIYWKNREKRRQLQR